MQKPSTWRYMRTGPSLSETQIPRIFYSLAINTFSSSLEKIISYNQTPFKLENSKLPSNIRKAIAHTPRASITGRKTPTNHIGTEPAKKRSADPRKFQIRQKYVRRQYLHYGFGWTKAKRSTPCGPRYGTEPLARH